MIPPLRRISVLILLLSVKPVLAASVSGEVEVNDFGEPTVCWQPLVADDGTPEGLIEQVLAWKGERVELVGTSNEETWVQKKLVASPLTGPFHKARPFGTFSPHRIEYPPRCRGEYDLRLLGSAPVLIDEQGRIYELLGPLAESSATLSGVHRVSAMGFMFSRENDSENDSTASMGKVAGRLWVKGWRPQGAQGWMKASDSESSQALEALEALATTKPERLTLRADVEWEPASREPALLDVTRGSYYRFHDRSQTGVPWLLFYARTVTVECGAVQAADPLVAGSTGWVAVSRVVSPTREGLRGQVTDRGRTLITGDGRIALAVAPYHPGPSTGAKQIRRDTTRLLESLAGRDVELTGWAFHLTSGRVSEALVLEFTARFQHTRLPVKVHGLDDQGRLLVAYEGRAGLDRVPSKTVEFFPYPPDPEPSGESVDEATVLGAKDFLPGQD